MKDSICWIQSPACHSEGGLPDRRISGRVKRSAAGKRRKKNLPAEDTEGRRKSFFLRVSAPQREPFFPEVKMFAGSRLVWRLTSGGGHYSPRDSSLALLVQNDIGRGDRLPEGRAYIVAKMNSDDFGSCMRHVEFELYERFNLLDPVSSLSF